MIVVVMKHKSSRDQLRHMFLIKSSTFIRLMHGFMDNIYDFFVEKFVEKCHERFTMHSMIEESRLFKYFSVCHEAVDVTFLRFNRPFGKMQEAKNYVSGNYKLWATNLKW